MIQVALETQDHKLVTRGLIPPFLDLPEVILWGDRTFRLYPGEHPIGVPVSYQEVFAVALVQPLEGTLFAERSPSDDSPP